MIINLVTGPEERVIPMLIVVDRLIECDHHQEDNGENAVERVEEPTTMDY